MAISQAVVEMQSLHELYVKEANTIAWEFVRQFQTIMMDSENIVFEQKLVFSYHVSMKFVKKLRESLRWNYPQPKFSVRVMRTGEYSLLIQVRRIETHTRFVPWPWLLRQQTSSSFDRTQPHLTMSGWNKSIRFGGICRLGCRVGWCEKFSDRGDYLNEEEKEQLFIPCQE